MARSIQKIRQDLIAIEERIKTLEVKLSHIYRDYINSLSQFVQKHFVLASFQICTQLYPEAFLKLSFSQREELQKTLRKLAQKNRDCLTELTENLAELSTPIEGESPLEGEKKWNPKDAIQKYESIEQKIDVILDGLSKAANQILQRAEVLPPQLPAKLLDVALQVEERGTPISGLPNLLNLLLETPGDREDKPSTHDDKIAKITIVHLRLSEIEFSEPTLNVQRNQIKTLLEQLGKGQQQYSQKQRELAVAEAEAAWRSCWHQGQS